MESKYDGFRSIATRKAVNSNLITNVEIPFSPHELFLDISEALLLKGFELAPFFDTRWNSTSDENFHMNDWAAGLSFSFEARAFGLAPATMTFMQVIQVPRSSRFNSGQGCSYKNKLSIKIVEVAKIS